MSRHSAKESSVTLPQILAAKAQKKRLSMVTCYDAAFARIVNHSDVDMVLVGDSLGNVMLGHNGTIPVTLDDMIHHCRAVSRVLTRPFLCVDMPFMTYNVSVEQALANAGRAIQEGGAQAVKVEGGKAICPQVAALTANGIPVIGHLGLTPQSVHALGGYKVQGKTPEAKERLIQDAKALQEAGAFAIVLEMVPAALADEISRLIVIPTIGIGAGPGCDGQVLVMHDLLGFDESFNPKFLKKYAQLGSVIKNALNSFDQEVKNGQFPTVEQNFS